MASCGQVCSPEGASADIESCASSALPMKSLSKGVTVYASSKKLLADSLNHPDSATILNNPYKPTSATMGTNTRPITTSIFDMFKIGPGPSSSHTIGPMKASFDFLQDLRALFSGTECPDLTLRYGLDIHLHGSLSATGKGHGTDTAIVGGLLGWLPPTCDPDALVSLMTTPGQCYRIPVVTDITKLQSTVTLSPTLKPLTTGTTVMDCLNSTGESAFQLDLTPTTTGTLTPKANRSLYLIDELAVGEGNFIWNDPSEGAHFPHPNTLLLILYDELGRVLLRNEYYSVGGGFIQKKGYPQEDARSTEPEFPYTNFKELRQHVLEHEPSLNLADLMIRNETALTGATEDNIYERIGELLDAMERAVERGLRTRGKLPGTIGLARKAAIVYEQARRNSFRADSFMTFLNAYCMAASEENAAGRVVVTAPTSGASGVFPGLLYFMKHHLFIDRKTLCRSLMAGCAIGFLVKRNASISGAEMGCMGEIGTASAMGAAMLAFGSDCTLQEIETAAEIAIEHHLGLTCDPIGGYVQIPCIQRNPMGAIKAYNAFLLARTCDTSLQKISLDMVIRVMRETGEDMSKKYKETSEAGLALSMTEC